MSESVVVIGGGAGLGGAILEQLLDDSQCQGWITYHRHPGDVESLTAALPGLRTARCDVREVSDIHGLVEEISQSSHPRVRSLVYAVVAPTSGKLVDLSPAGLADAITVNALAFVTVVAEFKRILAPGGAVLFVTSSGAARAWPGYGPIGVGKAAGEAIVRYLAVELSDMNVRVNAVSPGPVETRSFRAVFDEIDRRLEAVERQTPRGSRIALTEVASVARALCDPSLSAVTGQIVTADAGYSLR